MLMVGFEPGVKSNVSRFSRLCFKVMAKIVMLLFCSTNLPLRFFAILPLNQSSL